jgi:type III restriction enzyme
VSLFNLTNNRSYVTLNDCQEGLVMYFKLEQLEYQQQALNSMVKIFHGTEKNNFDNACYEGIRSNYLSLTPSQVEENIKQVILENGIPGTAATSTLTPDYDFCIEMETGTGKTLVYIKIIFELFKHYGFTKFIILVPSVAIKEGVLTAFDIFKDQLEEIYGFKPDCFEYDSKKLNKVTNFIEDQHPQVMVITLQSFNTDDRILNQAQRENLFLNMPFIEAIGRTRPILIMDEPQEGMDTPNSIERIKTMNPLCKIRCSATHKVVKNLIYRLTPFESYKKSLVKKIEVLSVAERNDEAVLKLEVSNTRTFPDGRPPQAKLKAWIYSESKNKYELKETPWLNAGDKLENKTGNVSYRGYTIDRIYKSLRDKKFKVSFSNGVELVEKEQSKDFAGIFREQLYWLIDTHFRKKERLKKHGIKCLSLIFIDKVDNYMKEDGIIKILFREQYKRVFSEFYRQELLPKDIEKVQGYYFARTGKGEFTDNEKSMISNKEIYDLILKDKETLLSLENPVEFIFSHSALGVGWDNPNVFNIATLNQSYSEIKKRQEIGRGLRICVDHSGQRVYDPASVKEGEEINLLTVIPNETYETFVTQYQAEIKEIYGTMEAGAETRYKEKGVDKSEKRLRRNDAIFNHPSFKEFWKKLSGKTDYITAFDEDTVIERAIQALNEIEMPYYEAEIALNRVKSISEESMESENLGRETVKLKPRFSPLDIIEEISENTRLSYPAAVKIFSRLKNTSEIVKNVPRFMQEAITRLKNIELEEMLRALEYRLTDEKFDLSLFEEIIVRNTERIADTPNRGVYDKIVWDSELEKEFAAYADRDTEVVCFLKLPDFYRIKTPIGDYNPDFGIVLKRGKIRADSEEEFYFVVEIKGTNDINDKKALTGSEIYKIKCALKHFEALGIDTRIHYYAPVKDYITFKNKAGEVYNG